jgi:RNA polymerase sigma factor (sigma-70 family)
MAAVPSEGRAAAISTRVAPEGEATRLLYERHQRKILSFCMHQLGNREEAEDATQVTFMNAFRGLKRGTSPEFESAWLFKIAHNVCLTRQRNSYRRRVVEVTSDVELMEDRIPAYEGDTDELFGLQTALRVIPDQQRRALLLREWQGLSYKEIADEMVLSQAAVETLLFRARRSLADALTTDPSTRRKRGRPRVTSNMGSAIAALKSLFLGGSVKVAATVATVAATSVVSATPAVRHDVVEAFSHGRVSTPPTAPARVASTHALVPVAALAHEVASVVPSRHKTRTASTERTVVKSPTRPAVAVAEAPHPTAPAERPEASATPAAGPVAVGPAAAGPAPADQPAPSVPTPAPSPQGAAPAEPAPEPARAPTSTVSPNTASAPTPAPTPAPVQGTPAIAPSTTQPVTQSVTQSVTPSVSVTDPSTTTMTLAKSQPVPDGETMPSTSTTKTTQPAPTPTSTTTTTTTATVTATPAQPTPVQTTITTTQTTTAAPAPAPATITPLQPTYTSGN